MRQHLYFHALFFLLLLVTTAVAWRQPAAIEDFRNFVFDTFQRLDPPDYDPNAPVRILAVDEQSLKSIGQWPLPRSRIAEMVQRLGDLGASAIAFDVLFAEPDRTSPENVLQTMPDGPVKADVLRRLTGEETNDARLSRTIGTGPVILGATLQTEGPTQIWESKSGFVVAGDAPEPFLPAFATAVLPIPPLRQAASGLGATNWLPDRDQIVRRVPLFVRTASGIMPSLALEALRVAQGASTYIVKSSNANGTTAFGAETGINAVKVGDLEIATSADGSIRPRYTHSAAARFISAADLLDGRVGADEIRGRIIFVGTTAVGLGDVRATPLDAVVPGVEIHAEVLEQLLAGKLLSRPDWALGAEFLTSLVCLVVVGLFLPRVAPLIGAIISAGIVALLFGGAWAAFNHGGLLLDAAFPSLTVAVAYLAGASILWQIEERAKRQVRLAFGKFVSPAVVARIAENPKLLVLSGETRDLTILFSDLRSFSTISEGLDAHEVAHFLNEYLTPMTDVILEHDGTVDKYIGDAIVAFWNAPLDVADHTRRAVDAALAMRAALAQFNRRQASLAEHGTKVVGDVRNGMGLNFGACSVGNMGSLQRFDYSALGDPVNVAARLESLTKGYGVDVLATIAVVERVPDYAWLEVDEVRVKGRSAATKLFTLAGNQDVARSQAFRDWSAQHGAMLRASRTARAQHAADAARALTAIVTPHWRPLYQILAKTYLEAADRATEQSEIVSLAHAHTPE